MQLHESAAIAAERVKYFIAERRVSLPA